MSGVLVTLRTGRTTINSQILTDGSFHFENLTEGPYTLFVSKLSSGRKLEIALKLTTFKEIDGDIKPFKTITYKKELSVSWLADKFLHVLDFVFKDNKVKILNNG